MLGDEEETDARHLFYSLHLETSTVECTPSLPVQTCHFGLFFYQNFVISSPLPVYLLVPMDPDTLIT